jgi:hypothetical protein
MSDLKRIGLRPLMQRLADVLRIEGVSQRAPISLDTSRLVPVVNVEPGWADYRQVQLYSGTVSIAGLSFVDWCFLGPDALSFCSAGIPAFAVDQNTADRECVILGMCVTVVYDAAGRNADAAAFTSMRLDTLRQAGGASVSLVPECRLKSWAVVNTTELFYSWSHPWWMRPQYLGVDPSPTPWINGIMTMAPVLVPAGARYMIRFAREQGGVWPANTSCELTAQVVSCPKGMRPPGI